MKIDKLDLEIIKHLQDDARLSFRELSKKLGVPHTTVFTRARCLLRRGIINKFTAVMHPHEIGLQVGYLVIHSPPSESKKVAEKLASFDEVRQVYRTFDGKVISKVVVSSLKPNTGFEEFLSKLDGYNFTAYPVHDVVKYDDSVHVDLLKTLDIYGEQ